MNLLLTGAYKWTGTQISELEKLGFNVLFSEREDEPFDFHVGEIDAVVCNWLFVNHDISEFRSLKFIQLLSAGLDRVPLDYINKHQIALKNARGVYSIPMAEFAMAGVLQLCKKLRFFSKNQAQCIWEKNREIRELSGMRVLIVGAGSVGTEVAKKFLAFTESVFGVDLYPDKNLYMKDVYPIFEIKEQLEKSDVVIVTLPLNSDTKGMFSYELFSHMKQGAIFVNIARGGVVDEVALCDALENRLWGGVLDVFQKEPLNKESPLWKKENVLITPHNSFASDNNAGRMWSIIRENIVEFLENHK